MSYKYLYLLTVTDRETGDLVSEISAYSKEGLLRNLGKTDRSIDEYEKKEMADRTEEEAKIDAMQYISDETKREMKEIEKDYREIMKDKEV